jgi:transcriptional regulator with XRE-family HTH domain
VIRLVREALGWRQADLGYRTGYSQATISRLENGGGRITDVAVLVRLAEVLGLPCSVLGLAGRHCGASTPAESTRTVGDVKRSELLRGFVGAAAALSLPAVLTEDRPARIDRAVVTECRAALGRLYKLDDRVGGAPVYPLAVHLVDRLRNTLTHASYRPADGAGLRAVAAAAAEHTGWLAYDAGHPDRARQWWLEALHLSELGGATDAHVTTLASMARQAVDSQDPRQGRDAVALIGAARRTAGSSATPRMRSLLAAREAMGHARLGDRSAALRALAASERLLDGGARPQDPAWLRFWDHADLAAHQRRAALFLRDLTWAERAGRVEFSASDATAYPRNHAISGAALGGVLARAGKLEESIAVATPVVGSVGTFGSRRLRSELRDVVQVLDRHEAYPPARRFTAWSRKLLAV